MKGLVGAGTLVEGATDADGSPYIISIVSSSADTISRYDDYWRYFDHLFFDQLAQTVETNH